jgi:hypothetical protein
LLKHLQEGGDGSRIPRYDSASSSCQTQRIDRNPGFTAKQGESDSGVRGIFSFSRYRGK